MNGSPGALSPKTSRPAVVPSSFSFAMVAMSLHPYPYFCGLIMDGDHMRGILLMCRRCLSQAMLLNGYSQSLNVIFREGRVMSSLSYARIVFRRKVHSRRFLQGDDAREHDPDSGRKENVLQQTSGLVDPLHRNQYFISPHKPGGERRIIAGIDVFADSPELSLAHHFIKQSLMLLVAGFTPCTGVRYCR